jgi:type IV secretion system protein VirB8
VKKLTDMLPALTADAEREIDRMEHLESTARRAWLVAKGAGVIAGLSVLGMAAQARLRTVQFVPIIVDKTTGETTVMQGTPDGDVPVLDSMDKHFAARFVMARYGYVWHFLKRDYDIVARMATAEVFAPYSRLYYPEVGEGVQKKWGDKQIHRINVITKRPTGANPDGSKNMVVTYEKESIYTDKAQPNSTSRHVATLTFGYYPKAMKTEIDRDENPFGWICLACRSDLIEKAEGAVS